MFFVALLATVLTACANTFDVRRTCTYGIPSDELRVIVQVCLPDKKVVFEDVKLDLTDIPKEKTLREERENGSCKEAGKKWHKSIELAHQNDADKVTVRRWVYDHYLNDVERSFLGLVEVHNHGSGTKGLKLRNNSDKNQPIYEYHGGRQDDIIAFGVSSKSLEKGKSKFLTYWYKPPAKIPTGEYTKWLEPFTQESNENRKPYEPGFSWYLMRGKKFETPAVKIGAPKIRYKVITFEDDHDEERLWNRAQKEVARIRRYTGSTPEEFQRVHYAPQSKETIPGCE